MSRFELRAPAATATLFSVSSMFEDSTPAALVWMLIGVALAVVAFLRLRVRPGEGQ